MTKEKYEAPELEILFFECEDVITTSPGGTQTPWQPASQGYTNSGFNLF